MPDKDGNILPPLLDEVFDGEKEKTEVNFNKCSHKDIKLISPTELRCSCGVGYTGTSKDINNLFNLLKN